MQVALVGLVDVLHPGSGQGAAHARSKAVAGGNFLHDGAHGGVVPALFGALAQLALEVGTARLDADLVRRAAVLHLVHLEAALVHQRLAAPAQLQLDGGALTWQGQLAIVVGQGQLQRVGRALAVLRQREVDQARVHLGGDVLAVDHQAVVGRGVAVAAHAPPA